MTQHEARDEQLGKGILLRPLPRVRIEAPSSGCWPIVHKGLEKMGFDVLDGGGDILDGEVVLVPEGVAPAANATFLVIGDEGSIRAAQSALAGGASGYFAAPFDFLCMGVSICAAARQARALARLSVRIQGLSKGLQSDQVVCTAVGILMERLRLPRAEAFARLRQYSRSERRRIAELAAEFVSTSESVGRRLHAISGAFD